MRLRTVRRTVRERGCRNCRDLFGYTVVDDDGQKCGEVWQERASEDHPEAPHFGFEWKARLADGKPVTGPWSRHRGFEGDTFCSRVWALTMMCRRMANAPRDS